jgi:hypothetical protein
VELAGGVQAGERVVTEGVVKLRDGAKFAEADALPAAPATTAR